MVAGLRSLRCHPVLLRLFLCTLICASFAACRPTQREITEPFWITLTGEDHRWQAVYGETGLKSLGDIHVPASTQVLLRLCSNDYVYTVALPDLGLKEVAVPNLEFSLSLGPTAVGNYSFVGEQLCNEPNTLPPIRLIVEDIDTFQAFLSSL